MSLTYRLIQQHPHFHPPAGWELIRTIDMHTGGEPLRVIVGGFPAIEGENILARRRYIRRHYDHLRRALMHEPRGHADMYGALLLPPDDADADFGVLFLHNEGYSTMCGHAVIALARLSVEMGWIAPRSPETEVVIDAPCGRLSAYARLQGDRVSSAYFFGVPSFCVALDQTVDVPGLGMVRYDLAYGGAFYAYVDARPLQLSLSPGNYRQLIEAGMAIKRAVAKADQRIQHPFEPDLSFLYGTIFTGEALAPDCHSRNVCIFADGELDRSPTGSGLMGRLAIHYARGDIGLSEVIRVESILGSTFTGSVAGEQRYGDFPAIVPRVEGTAFITGQHTFLIDPDDPFRTGFFLR